MNEFTREQMEQCFLSLTEGQDWKGAICKRIAKQDATLAVQSIKYFTGADSYITRDGNFKTVVVSDGYRGSESRI